MYHLRFSWFADKFVEIEIEKVKKMKDIQFERPKFIIYF